MTTINLESLFTVTGPAADLDNAQKSYEDAGNEMEAARRFLQEERSRLNESQFQSRARELVGDPALAELTAAQHILRCRYMAGRLAVSCCYDRLQRRAGEFASRVVGSAAVIEQAPPSLQHALLSGCYWANSRLADSSKQAIWVMDNDLGRDLTDGLAQTSLIQTYWKLCQQGQSMLLEGKKRDPHNCENHCWFVRLADVNQNDFQAVAPNDELAVLGAEFKDLATHNIYVEGWNAYEAVKYNLNEPQYAQRLRDADDPARAKLIEDELLGRRASFLRNRTLVSNIHGRLVELKDKALVLAKQLVAVIGQVPDIGTGHLVAMSNVINAYMMSGWVDFRVIQWNAELSNSAALAARSEKALRQALSLMLAGAPYSSASSSC